MYFKRLVSIYLFLSLSLSAFSDDNKKIEQEFYRYIESLKSVAIDFAQHDTRGEFASGTLVILRPDKFLCNYYPPYPLLISSSKSFISIYDFDLEQISRIDAKDNIFNFLLANERDLASNFKVTKTEKVNDKINITL